MPRACGILLLSVLSASAAAADKPRVTLEVIAREGLAPTASQQWYQALSKLGIDGLRIRSDDLAGEMGVTNQGSQAAPAYKVVGILSADNVLRLPGGAFGPRDTGKLQKWLDELRDAGVEGVTQPRSAFGLLPRQLQAVNDDLMRPLGFSTKGMPAAAAVAQIAKSLRNPLAFEPGATRALAQVKLDDELDKLSRGTALAAIVRPAGLVVRPVQTGGAGVEYRIERPQAGEGVWPIGWPPKERRSETLPALFEMLNVEIKEIPVSEALAAIEARLKVPLVFDRNALALHGVDPTTAPADVPEKRMSYSQVLRTVLSQAKLTYELRVDEAEKPFLWITTVKPAP
jgi:hypothetical protein